MSKRVQEILIQNGMSIPDNSIFHNFYATVLAFEAGSQMIEYLNLQNEVDCVPYFDDKEAIIELDVESLHKVLDKLETMEDKLQIIFRDSYAPKELHSTVGKIETDLTCLLNNRRFKDTLTITLNYSD